MSTNLGSPGWQSWQKTCQYCRSLLPAGATRCSQCGAPLPSVGQPPPAPPPGPPPAGGTSSAATPPAATPSVAAPAGPPYRVLATIIIVVAILTFGCVWLNALIMEGGVGIPPSRPVSSGPAPAGTPAPTKPAATPVPTLTPRPALATSDYGVKPAVVTETVAIPAPGGGTMPGTRQVTKPLTTTVSFQTAGMCFSDFCGSAAGTFRVMLVQVTGDAVVVHGEILFTSINGTGGFKWPENGLLTVGGAAVMSSQVQGFFSKENARPGETRSGYFLFRVKPEASTRSQVWNLLVGGEGQEVRFGLAP